MWNGYRIFSKLDLMSSSQHYEGNDCSRPQTCKPTFQFQAQLLGNNQCCLLSGKWFHIRTKDETLDFFVMTHVCKKKKQPLSWAAVVLEQWPQMLFESFCKMTYKLKPAIHFSVVVLKRVTEHTRTESTISYLAGKLPKTWVRERQWLTTSVSPLPWKSPWEVAISWLQLDTTYKL